jgi:hypothetical protein
MAKTLKYQDYLANIYYDRKHPAAYAGVDKLYRAVQQGGKFVLGRDKIRSWLLKQEDYAVHREDRGKFQRRRVVAPFVDYQWDVDTASMDYYKKENDGYAYFVLAINILSKFVWTVPLRTKTAKEMVQAFKQMFSQGRESTHVRTDKGAEFVNKDVKQYLKKVGVTYFVTQKIVKASFAERAIKTIKARLTRYLTHEQVPRWIDILPESYNKTYHRSIRRSPASVKNKDCGVVETSIQREYDERWSRELFVVNQRFMRENIPQYELKDYSGEIISGKFYQNQLMQAYEQDTYLVEQIIRSRKKEGKKEYLVRWKGWAPKFDSWISEEDLKSLKGGVSPNSSS